MPLPDPEVVILGAGPAGASAALALAVEGVRVTLIDIGTPPAPRIESLPVNGLPLVEELGLGAAFAAARLGRAARMRIDWRDAPEMQDHGDRAPWLLDRLTLHRALQRAAVAAGARIVRGRARVSRTDSSVAVGIGDDILRARLAIDARGRSAIPSRGNSHERRPGVVALPFDGRLDEPPEVPTMRITALAGGWLWVALLPSGQVSGALFLDPDTLAGLAAEARRVLVVRCLTEAGPFCGMAATKIGRPQPSALRIADEVVTAGPVLRIGDAALARDPIASHGLVHALRSAAQAAAAAATILDPAGDDAAATAFMRDRHRLATEAARSATLATYAAQSRHCTAFWTASDAGPVSEPPAERPPLALGRPLELAAPLCRAAVLERGRIVWAEALLLPESGERAAYLGPMKATDLARLLAPPAPLAVLAARLDLASPAGTSAAILARLVSTGALVNAPAATGRP